MISAIPSAGIERFGFSGLHVPAEKIPNIIKAYSFFNDAGNAFGVPGSDGETTQRPCRVRLIKSNGIYERAVLPPAHF